MNNLDKLLLHIYQIDQIEILEIDSVSTTVCWRPP